MPVQRRHRSTVACQNCRKRKVRCSVTVTGIPCSNCTQDRTTCSIQEINHELPRSSVLASSRQFHAAEPPGVVGNDVSYVPRLPDALSSRIDCSHPVQSSCSSVSGDVGAGAGLINATARLDSARQRDFEEEQSGAELSYAARSQGNSSSGTPFYTGEQPGVTSLIDAQEPLPRHIMLKSRPPSILSAVDLEYLQRKGVLSPLRACSHQELLKAYFHHVHPMLPILYLSKLEELKSSDAIPLRGMLLYWSMAVVAVNFVPADVWKTENFTSRKHMKDTMYERAKCMYDTSGETDKEVMLQAALLLSFWHSEKDSHSQPWYWSGVAINWCQIIGLHRDPDAVRVNTLVSPQRRHLWRRLWASCLFRDRWLSLTLGRPLRIRLSDCDMPFPNSRDVLIDMETLPSELHSYLPTDLVIMVEHWVLLIQLSKILGKILSLFYHQLGRQLFHSQFEDLEADLNKFMISEPKKMDMGPLASFSYYHLQLHFQATLITFYRPFLSVVPRGLPPGTEESWTNRVRSRMESAATQANSVIDCIAREGLLAFATPMTPPLLVPAMHIHLLGCTSQNHLARRLSLNKLEMCMTVMRELQKAHTSASLFCGVFGEAIRQLPLGPLDETIWGVAQNRSPPTGELSSQEQTGIFDFENIANQAMVTDDILESLLNETSSSNFWESMNSQNSFPC